jgi:hypothetical protein
MNPVAANDGSQSVPKVMLFIGDDPFYIRVQTKEERELRKGSKRPNAKDGLLLLANNCLQEAEQLGPW